MTIPNLKQTKCNGQPNSTLNYRIDPEAGQNWAITNLKITPNFVQPCPFDNFPFSGRLTGCNRLFNVLTLTGTAFPTLNYGLRTLDYENFQQSPLDRVWWGLIKNRGSGLERMEGTCQWWPCRCAGNWENKPFQNFTTRQRRELRTALIRQRNRVISRARNCRTYKGNGGCIA